MPKFFLPHDLRCEMPELVENSGYGSHVATLGGLLAEFGIFLPNAVTENPSQLPNCWKMLRKLKLS